MKRVRVVVVGAGVIGLSTAVCVAEALPGCAVTLAAARFSPDTTSDGAAGILFMTQYPGTTAHASHKPPVLNVPFWSDVVLGFRPLTELELRRFPEHRFGQAFTSLKCECTSYLPWLEKSLQELAGRYDLVVNCSGLGSRALAGDGQVRPVRGQVLKVQAPWLSHFIRDGDGKTYVYPGCTASRWGGTRQEDDWRPPGGPRRHRRASCADAASWNRRWPRARCWRVGGSEARSEEPPGGAGGAGDGGGRASAVGGSPWSQLRPRRRRGDAELGQGAGPALGLVKQCLREMRPAGQAVRSSSRPHSM
ncbi:hypothetical protein CRUP_023815 [Coryphaenoides rupestris]|nr:hypothetical protein CRUP_023815 [Coryphaenoides rupestris]